MREKIVRITTYDTKKTFEFPAKEGVENPQLWEVELRTGGVGHDGRTRYGLSKETSIFVERHTLEDHGLTGKIIDKKGKEVIPPKTPEDLILELLEIVGVYPTEG